MQAGLRRGDVGLRGGRGVAGVDGLARVSEVGKPRVEALCQAPLEKLEHFGRYRSVAEQIIDRQRADAKTTD